MSKIPNLFCKDIDELLIFVLNKTCEVSTKKKKTFWWVGTLQLVFKTEIKNIKMFQFFFFTGKK